MSKKNFKKLLAGLLALAIVLSFFPTGSAYAATKKTTTSTIFKDVSKSTDYKKAIEWLYTRGAWTGLAKKGGNLKPYNVMTQAEFNRILKNMYGSKISLSTGSKSKLTQKYATNTLTNVSKQLGYKVTWKGGTPSAKVTRCKAAYYVKGMIDASGGRLKP